MNTTRSHRKTENESVQYARWSSYLDRYVRIECVGDRVTGVAFPGEVDPAIDSKHDLLDRVERYLAGKRIDFADVPVSSSLPEAEQTVLDAVREIPYGEQVLVSKLARMAGLSPEREDHRVLVQIALDENPVPLVIPDHRVRDGPSGAEPRIEMLLRSLE